MYLPYWQQFVEKADVVERTLKRRFKVATELSPINNIDRVEVLFILMIGMALPCTSMDAPIGSS